MAETTLQKAYTEKAVTQRNAVPPIISEVLGGVMPHIPDLLPSDITTEQFRAALYLELAGRPQLAECTRASLREAVLKAAMHGLLPGRDCHVLPFRDTKSNTRKATYVPNYMGIILALERTGKVRRAFAHGVYEGDEWGFDYFADRPIHKPAASLGHPQGKVLFYYGAVVLKDGTCHFEVLELKDIDAIRLRAPAHDSGPWVNDPVMMARKTALKRMSKYVKLTEEVRALLDEDDAREREDIPEARHRKNISDLFGDRGGSDPTAFAPRDEPPPPPPDTRAAGEDGLPYVAQIEAGILAQGAQIEPWYVWAERRYKKGREAFAVTDWEDFLAAVRTAAGRRAVAVAVGGTAMADAAATFVDPETGEELTPGRSEGPSWGGADPDAPNLFLEEEQKGNA